jgi:tetratricopeptide (TPR) repeat protein
MSKRACPPLLLPNSSVLNQWTIDELPHEMRKKTKNNKTAAIVGFSPTDDDHVDSQQEQHLLLYKSISNMETDLPPLPFPRQFHYAQQQCGGLATSNENYDKNLFNVGLAHYQLRAFHDASQSFSSALMISSNWDVRAACFNNLILLLHICRGLTLSLHRSKKVMVAINQFLHELLYQRHESSMLAITLVTAGYVEFNKGNYHSALEFCTTVQQLSITSDRNRADLAYNMGVLYYHLKDYSLSLENFRSYVNAANGTEEIMASALYFMGSLYQEQGDLRCSLYLLTQSITLKHDSPETWFKIGKILHDADDYECALNAYHEALFYHSQPLSISSANILLEIGRIHHVQFRLPESIDAYKKALTISSSILGASHVHVARLWNIIGNLYVELQDTKNAMMAFTSALQIAPTMAIGGNHRIPVTRDLHAACA